MEKGLSNEQLNQVIQWNRPLARRCLNTRSSDTLPKKTDVNETPKGFITNTEPSTRPGQHWVAFVIWTPREIEFFDSYGMTPGFYSSALQEYFDRFDRRRPLNRKDVQSIDTAVCGQWCLYWLWHRLVVGKTTSSLLRAFREHFFQNDLKMARFVLRHLVLPHRGKKYRASQGNPRIPLQSSLPKKI